MRRQALPGGSQDYYPVMRPDQREHCRLDLDKYHEGSISADQFIRLWGDALRALLIPQPETPAS